jgi:hypothetical protein
MSRHDSSEHAAFARRGSPGLWFAVFGPPTAWFASLVVSYFAVHEVCRLNSSMAPRVVSVIALVVAVAAGFGGRSIWIRADQGGRLTAERTRFLAQMGVLGAAVFSLIILLQIVATLMLPSCHERPRTPQSPDVLAPPTRGHTLPGRV